MYAVVYSPVEARVVKIPFEFKDVRFPTREEFARRGEEEEDAE